MSDFNCYVSAMAPNEDVARDVCRDVFFDNPLELVHVEPGETTEPGQPDSEATYVFTFWAESFCRRGVDGPTARPLHWIAVSQLPN